MKNTMLPLALAAAGLFVLPAIGQAQALDGAFVNGNIGNSTLDSGPIDDNDTSYGVNVGYRWAVSPETRIGLEVGYVDLGKYSGSVDMYTTPISPIGTLPPEPTISAVNVTTEMNGWTIGASGRFNLSPKWHVGGRAGFLRASVDFRAPIYESDGSFVLGHHDDNADGWYAGAGVGYDFSNHFSVGLNYDYYSARAYGYRMNPDVVSVSGEFRF